MRREDSHTRHSRVPPERSSRANVSQVSEFVVEELKDVSVGYEIFRVKATELSGTCVEVAHEKTHTRTRVFLQGYTRTPGEGQHFVQILQNRQAL